MSYGTYRQYDSRWGRKNYNGSSNYAQAACGPTSCANILHAIDSSITPLTTGKYMQTHGYAIRNQGTSWNGIPACLKAYGAQDVREVTKMSDAFSLCSKGYVGVFLFEKGTKGGITWTTSGHFVAVTGYKHKNGKHYFRTFDSGGRKHDGWYCYETQMKGLIRKMWLCRLTKKIPKPSGKYKGTIPKPTLKKGSKGDSVKNLQKFLVWYHPAWKSSLNGNFGATTHDRVKAFQLAEGLTADGVWGKKTYTKASTYKAKETPKTPQPSEEAEKAVAWAKKIARSGKYTYKHWNDKDKKTKLCPICHPELKGKYKGWNCIGFVSAAMHHGAGLKSVECSCKGIGTDGFLTKVTLNTWTKRNGKGWKAITNGGKKGGADISASKLIPGDILICYDAKGKFHHVVLYVGSKCYIDCTNTSKRHIATRRYENLCKRYHVTRAFRYIGK